MLFVLDVGNTNTVLGVFARGGKAEDGGEGGEAPRYDRLLAHWRVASVRKVNSWCGSPLVWACCLGPPYRPPAYSEHRPQTWEIADR